MRTSWLLLISLLLLVPGFATAQPAPAPSQPAPEPSVNPCFAAGVKNSIVFLGRFVPNDDPHKDPTRQYFATGFLLQVEDRFYLVTAKHVVDEIAAVGKEAEVIAFVNNTSGQIAYMSLHEIRTVLQVDWVTSKTADIAMLPFGIREDFAVKFIPEALFLTSDKVFELEDVFFVSYQPGIEEADRITPITRGGMVSVRNSDGTFYVDALSFPGNSGSPVFVKPTAAAFTKGGISLGGNPDNCKFIGVVGEYLTYQEMAVSAQTKRPRVIFEENTGLAKVWPAQAVLDVIASPEFRTQHERLKRTNPK